MSAIAFQKEFLFRRNRSSEEEAAIGGLNLVSGLSGSLKGDSLFRAAPSDRRFAIVHVFGVVAVVSALMTTALGQGKESNFNPFLVRDASKRDEDVGQPPPGEAQPDPFAREMDAVQSKELKLAYPTEGEWTVEPEPDPFTILDAAGTSDPAEGEGAVEPEPDPFTILDAAGTSDPAEGEGAVELEPDPFTILDGAGTSDPAEGAVEPEPDPFTILDGAGTSDPAEGGGAVEPEPDPFMILDAAGTSDPAEGEWRAVELNPNSSAARDSRPAQETSQSSIREVQQGLAERSTLGQGEVTMELVPYYMGLMGPVDIAYSLEINGLTARGQYEEALIATEKYVSKVEEMYGEGAIKTAIALCALETIYSEFGRFSDAQRIAIEIRDIFINEFGRDHVLSMGSNLEIAGYLRDQERFSEAEELILEVVEAIEKSKANDATTLNSAYCALAEVYELTGRFEKARGVLLEAIRLCEKLSMENLDWLLITQSALANNFFLSGEFEAAERILKKLLVARKKIYGDDSVETSPQLCELAACQIAQQKFVEGRSNLEAAKAILESGLDERRRSELPPVYKNLAILDFIEGDLQQADEWLTKSIEASGRISNARDRNLLLLNSVVKSLNGKQEEAIHWAEIVIDSRYRLLGQVLSFTSEVERLSYSRKTRFYDLVATLGMEDKTAEAVLRCKGIVLESLLEDKASVMRARNLGLTELIEQIQLRRADLRQLIFGKGADAIRPGLAERREEELMALEKQLARRLRSGYGTRNSLALEVADVAQAISEGSALIEYFQYVDLHTMFDESPEVNFGAVIVRPNKPVQQVRLGGVVEIRSTVRKLREALRNVDEEAVEASSRELYRSLIEPLRGGLKDVKELILCPDSDLHFVSFAALFDDDQRFLAEQFLIRYVAAGRDLLRETGAISERPSVILGGADYLLGERSPALAQGGGMCDFTPREILRNVESEQLSSINFSPLPGAEKEAKQIEEVLRTNRIETLVYTAREATEEKVRSAASPRILHLATHGFFLQDPKSESSNRNRVATRASEVGAYEAIEGVGSLGNPMYRSGVALSGAQATLNAWREGAGVDPKYDGILMAAEVADLDLRGTDLVTLSACNTGTGEIVSGEGVLGLRRGFVLAGAKNLLMTLWPIADDDTALLMVKFYKRYAETGDAAVSLAETQRAALVELRESQGVTYAIQRAGPFILSSQGKAKK